MKKLIGGILSASGWLWFMYDSLEEVFWISSGFFTCLIWVAYLTISSVIGKALME